MWGWVGMCAYSAIEAKDNVVAGAGVTGGCKWSCVDSRNQTLKERAVRALNC